MRYEGICARIDPPLIGIYYKNQQQKKKMYNILLNKLVLNPDVEEITEQLFKEHPQILKEEKISKEKIA